MNVGKCFHDLGDNAIMIYVDPHLNPQPDTSKSMVVIVTWNHGTCRKIP